MCCDNIVIIDEIVSVYYRGDRVKMVMVGLVLRVTGQGRTPDRSPGMNQDSPVND